MTKRKIFPALLILMLTLIFLLSSCSLSSKSIRSTYINEYGELIIEYTNGTIDNLGVIGGGSNSGSGNGNNQDGSTDSGSSGGSVGDTIIIEGTTENTALAASKAARSAVDVICTMSDGSHSIGSGVIYKYNAQNDGYFIITNYHVVYDAVEGVIDTIEVALFGNEYSEGFIKAQYVGGSLNYDIAVLFVKNCDIIKSSAATTVTVADSNFICIGDTSIAVGNARGEGISVTKGVISVDSENIEMTGADGKTTISFRVLRTDTPINNGNSGGGLYNSSGELIGIVNAKTVTNGVEGVGYAIPSTLVCNVADNIIDNCYGTYVSTVQRALLGITITISDSVSVYDPETGKISIKQTVVVAETSSSGLLAGKVKKDDVIKSVTINGHETQVVTRQHHVIDYMLQARVGDTGTLVLERTDSYGRTEEISISFTITKSCISSY